MKEEMTNSQKSLSNNDPILHDEKSCWERRKRGRMFRYYLSCCCDASDYSRIQLERNATMNDYGRLIRFYCGADSECHQIHPIAEWLRKRKTDK